MKLQSPVVDGTKYRSKQGAVHQRGVAGERRLEQPLRDPQRLRIRCSELADWPERHSAR